MKRTPSEQQLANWHAAIKKSGSARLKIRSLLRHFGCKRRGSVVQTGIPEWLTTQSPPIYVRGLDAANIDSRVTLALHPMKEIGKRAPDERWLCDRFERSIMKKLKLHDARPQYCPDNTRDKIDFLCKDREGRAVAVEVKYDDGQKRGVEQVLRYIGYLISMGGHKKPRGLLLTGYADPATRQALIGLDPRGEVRWYIYGIDSRKRIEVEEIKVKR